MMVPIQPHIRPIHAMKARTLLILPILLGTMKLLHAQDLPQTGEMPRPGLPFIAHGDEVALPSGLLLKSEAGPEAPPFVRSYALGFFSQGSTADEGRRLQRTALDLISLALKSNHTPATHEDSLTMHGDTGVLIVRATEGQHMVIADIIRTLRENTPGKPAAKPEATTRQTVRIYAIQAALGSIPEEGDEARREARAERWDSLMGLFDAALIMAGCEQPRPTFGLDNQTNCLVVGGTTEQMELISQAISACHENERLRPPSAAMELAPANSFVRIYALGRIFGIADSGDETHHKERTAKTEALISQIRTSTAMARLNKIMPELSFHGSSNSLIAKGTVAQMELITQAITAWRENTPDFRPVRGQ